MYFDRQNGEWIMSIIDEKMNDTRMVSTVDVNGNGRPYLVGTATLDDMFVWYENPGDPSNRPWKRQIIDTAPRPHHGHPMDIDGDGEIGAGRHRMGP